MKLPYALAAAFFVVVVSLAALFSLRYGPMKLPESANLIANPKSK